MRWLHLGLKIGAWLLVVLIITFGVGALFLKTRRAPDDSMAPNLMAGDKFLLCYRCDIEKGDAVLCDHPDPARKGVKIMGRVVGMEGDKVEIRQGLLRVNDAPKHVSTDSTIFEYRGADGRSKSLPYMIWEHPSLFGEQVPILMPKDANGQMRNHDPEQVPRGSYFLMGDHRPLTLGWTADGKVAPGGGCNSSFCYGPVPTGNCHGVIWFIYSAANRGHSAASSKRRFSFMP
ncbi:MAG: signal peptidase I [Deltaproteobacteria bacterium]|nr:signal peptidase I [Deltaproteobacteria bacterium]